MFSMPFRQPSTFDAARRAWPRLWDRAASTFARTARLAVAPLVVGAAACASTSGTTTSAGSPPPRATMATRGSGPADVPERVVRAPVLEREAFVRAVLAQNPTLEAARQGFRAAAARVRQAGTFEDPMLDLGIAPLSIAPSRAPLGFEVGISQKLPWFGKRALETEASEAEAAAAASDYETVERELGLTAVTLYGDYFVATRSLAIYEEHAALMHALHDSAVAQLASGRGSAGDALMAESELTHLEHDTAVLSAERDVTVAQMNELLHRAPELPLPPPPKELGLPRPADAGPSPVSGDAVATRPDIVATEQRARAQALRAERAERDAYPDVVLSGSYNSMWDMPQHRFMVGVGLSLPIQVGRRAGAADEARAMRAGLLSDAARLTDAARTQAFIARRQLAEATHVLELFEKRLLPVAREQIDAARAGFITARNPFNAVIEAERNLRGVELEYQTKRAEYGRRRAELDRALGRVPGRDWSEEKP